MRRREDERNEDRPAIWIGIPGLFASFRRHHVLREGASSAIVPLHRYSPSGMCGAGGLRLQAMPETTRRARVDATPARNRHVVVIEDEAQVRVVLKDLLTRKGCTVSVTADPKRGLTMLMRQAPDLVILSLKRSAMDGLEVLRKMKTHEEMMPVIVTAPLRSIRLAKEGVRLGAFDYLLKPFDPAYVIALVENALEQAANY